MKWKKYDSLLKLGVICLSLRQLIISISERVVYTGPVDRKCFQTVIKKRGLITPGWSLNWWRRCWVGGFFGMIVQEESSVTKRVFFCNLSGEESALCPQMLITVVLCLNVFLWIWGGYG